MEIKLNIDKKISVSFDLEDITQLKRYFPSIQKKKRNINNKLNKVRAFRSSLIKKNG